MMASFTPQNRLQTAMNNVIRFEHLAMLIRCHRLLALWLANAPYTIGCENQTLIDFKGVYRDFKSAYGISSHDLERGLVAGSVLESIREEGPDFHKFEPHHKRLELPSKLMGSVASDIEGKDFDPKTTKLAPPEKRLVNKLKFRLRIMEKTYRGSRGK